MYAIFSAIAVATRVFLGWYSDRQPGINSYLLATCLLGIGVIGNIFFALELNWAVFAGALMSYVLGWAWPGLLQWSVVRDNRLRVHAATGFFQSGSSLGAGLGPILFGAIVTALSYQTGWIAAAILGVAAASFLGLGTLSARRDGATGSDPIRPATAI
jgi:MFS family permease